MMRLREQELRNLYCVINDLRMASLAKLAPSLVRLPSVHFKQFCLKFDLRYSNAFEGHGCLRFHPLKNIVLANSEGKRGIAHFQDMHF